MAYVAQRIADDRTAARHALVGDARATLVPLVPVMLVAGASAMIIARWWVGTQAVVAPVAPALTGFLYQLPGVVVLGLLALRVLLKGNRTVGAQHLAEIGTRWSWVWVASSFVGIVSLAAELTGVGVPQVLLQPNLIPVLASSDRILTQVAALWVGLVVAMFGARLSSAAQNGALALLAASALLSSVPALASGHHAGNAFHGLAMVTLAVQVIAAVVWLGSLLGLVAHLRSFPFQLQQALPRFGDLASLCVLLIGLGGLLRGSLALGAVNALWQTSQGNLILAQTAALALLVFVGFRHRRRTVGEAASGQLPVMLRLAVGEIVLMGATVGITVVLSAIA